MLAGAAAFGWVMTPSGADVQARTAALAAIEGAQPLLQTQLAPDLVSALVSTEDERFFIHHGVDALGIARAILADLRQGCVCEGGSTITQQLVKQVYLGGDDHGLNKLRGVFLAFKIEGRISKRQILADYLTVTPLGYSRYGAVNASCDYFGRAPDALLLHQSALLAGMPQAPSAYDPTLHPQAALRRRAQVLSLMRVNGNITAAQESAAAAAPLLATGRGCQSAT